MQDNVAGRVAMHVGKMSAVSLLQQVAGMAVEASRRFITLGTLSRPKQ
ncbi:hypothetical protein J9874_01213 [Duffyella gerundensis]|nr:hypothetical protein [Duffyella gerundensis]UCB30684.1 hypothetical protein J9874_01213 [Duffyella gerundensis]